jgi:hypothetical protein
MVRVRVICSRRTAENMGMAEGLAWLDPVNDILAKHVNGVQTVEPDHLAGLTHKL